MTNDRYNGRPLVRLAELYVLWVIGHLATADESNLKRMTPKLRETFGVDGEWHHVIAAVLQLSPQSADTIRQMWTRNCEIAARNNLQLTAQQFAEMFVDKNFKMTLGP